MRYSFAVIVVFAAACGATKFGTAHRTMKQLQPLIETCLKETGVAGCPRLCRSIFEISTDDEFKECRLSMQGDYVRIDAKWGTAWVRGGMR